MKNVKQTMITKKLFRIRRPSDAFRRILLTCYLTLIPAILAADDEPDRAEVARLIRVINETQFTSLILSEEEHQAAVKQRNEAIGQLRTLGPSASHAVPDLVRIIVETNYRNRVTLADLLWRIGGEE